MADTKPPGINTEVGVALGAGVGAALFAVTSSPVWIGVGVAMGIVIGATFDQLGKNDSNDGDQQAEKRLAGAVGHDRRWSPSVYAAAARPLATTATAAATKSAARTTNEARYSPVASRNTATITGPLAPTRTTAVH